MPLAADLITQNRHIDLCLTRTGRHVERPQSESSTAIYALGSIQEPETVNELPDYPISARVPTRQVLGAVGGSLEPQRVGAQRYSKGVSRRTRQ